MSNIEKLINHKFTVILPDSTTGHATLADLVDVFDGERQFDWKKDGESEVIDSDDSKLVARLLAEQIVKFVKENTE